MEIRGSMKALNYARKLLLGDTKNILPFSVKPQKPDEDKTINGIQLERSTPESEGISSESLNTLYRRIAAVKHGNPHACMIIRNGKVISEGYFAPYSSSHWHVTHSMCKSFTGTAIGMLIDEGKLTLDETIASIFPEKINLLTSKRTKLVTVENLLTMQSGVQFKEVGAVIETDWLKSWFEAEVSFEPGTQFDYNSMNSYVLACIIKKKTGLGLVEYLTPRLFEPLGFKHTAWERSPTGIEKGGWGLYVHIEDAAKLGQLYLQNGLWTVDGKEKRLLSEEWVKAATTSHTHNDKGEEYGYQLWPDSTHHSFMFNGMFGQYVLVAPEKNIIIAVNAGAANLFTKSGTQQAIDDFLSTVNDSSPLPCNNTAYVNLQFTLNHLEYGKAVPEQPAPPTFFEKLKSFFTNKNTILPTLPNGIVELNGKSYDVPDNKCSLLPIIISNMIDYYPLGIKKISFKCVDDKFDIILHEGKNVYTIPVGFNEYRCGSISASGNVFAIGTKAKFVHDEDEHPVLKLTLCLLESSSTRTIKFIFLDDEKLLCKMSETPSVYVILEMMKGNGAASASLSLELFQDVNFLSYRVDKYCEPSFTATLVEKGTK